MTHSCDWGHSGSMPVGSRADGVVAPRPVAPRPVAARKVAVVLVFAVALALATAPPTAAELVYSALVDGVWVVQVQATPDQAARPVGKGLAIDASAPALSPDGGRVAFEVPGQGILICPIRDDAQCETLRVDLGWPVRPTWNPGTGELVFVRYVAGASREDSDILIASPDLDEVRPLLTQTGNQDSPDVSPDGRLLVYDSAQTVAMHRGTVQVVRHLWVMDLNTGLARPLAPGDSQDKEPDVSPDGRWVAFASDRNGEGFEIWVVGLDGRGLRQVTGGNGSKTWPAWSPDGETILYTRAHEGRTELWITAVDGSEAERYQPLPSSPDAQLRDPDWR